MNDMQDWHKFYKNAIKSANALDVRSLSCRAENRRSILFVMPTQAPKSPACNLAVNMLARSVAIQ